MAAFETSIEIEAPASAVWQAVTDVVHWPEWTKSMQEVRLLQAAALGPGAQVWIKQPGLAASTWTVVDWQAGRSFAWESRSMGIRTWANHAIESHEGGCRLVLTLTMNGGLAPLVAFLAQRTVRRYMAMEAEGMRQCALRNRQSMPTT